MKHIFNEVHYELTRKIAEGGMGLVYEATQRGIGGFRKVVAIKLIREEYSAIEEFRNNFIGEAKLVADLIHTSIVQTYHLGKVGEQYFMTMEYVSGWNLEEFLDRHVTISIYQLILPYLLFPEFAGAWLMPTAKTRMADHWE